MGLGAEAFTVMAILEARDMASEVYEKVSASAERFSTTMKGAAENAAAASAQIDESILQTASGADALDLATAKVEAAQSKAATATQAQAQAERDLLAVQEEAAAAADGDAAATDRLEAAAARLSVAQKAAGDATKALRDAQAEQSTISDVQAGSADAAAVANESAGSKLSGLASTVGKIGLGMDIAGGLMVKSAANFQSSTTVLATSGGETAGELDKARQGILNLAASTGTSTEELTNGLYMLGSAGFDVAHGGLQALQAASQGAKAENADLGTVSNALSTILTDYGIKVANNAKGQQAANAVMDQMIAVVQNGKTTTEALAGSLSAVLPVASSAKLGFDQIGGALATMTGQGMSAQQASQDLAHTIGSLQNPNAVAVKEMQSLGINANDVSKNLGKNGLTGTLGQLTQAITSHMGPAGMVIQNAFAASKAAAADANQEISAMPPNLQKLAQAYLNGSVSSKQWKTDLQGLDPVSAHLMTQFASTADKTHQFNDLLSAGSPAAQTYNAALSKMTGGSTGLTTALMLTGNNLSTFQSNVGKVSGAAKGAGSSVDGWQQIQGNFNQKLAEAKQSVDVMAVTIGTALLPTVSKIADAILKVVTPLMHWIQGHQKLVGIIFTSLAGLFSFVGAVNLGAKAFSAISGAFGTVGKAFSGIVGTIGKVASGIGKIPGLASSAWSGISSAASTMAGWASSAASWAGNAASVAAGWVKTGAQAVLAAGKFLVLQAAQLAQAAASGIATAAQWLFNAAMDANPITLVVIAIVALAAVFVVLWTKCAWFRDFWKGLWRDIESAAKTVWNALKSAFQDVANFFASAWHDIVSAAQSLWHDVVGAFDAIKDGITTAVDDVIDWVKSNWPLILAIITGPIGIVVDLIVHYWSQIKQWFTDGVHAVESILNWFTQLPGKFAQWMSDVGKAVTKGISDVLSFFAALPGKIISAIGSVDMLLLKKGKDILTGLWNGIENIWATITHFFTNIGSTILGWLGNAGSWLLQVGENIISGLWNGIENAVGGLFSNISGLGGDIVGAFKSVLSIFSPSRVMAEQVGKFIPAGIAVGITDNMGVIASAAKKAGQVTISAAKTGISAAPSIGAASLAGSLVTPASGGGGDVVFDFRGSQLMSDKDMQQLALKLGGYLAKTGLTQGGVKVVGM